MPEPWVQHHPRNFLYYVTEYIEGQTLRKWKNDHPQPSLPEVRGIVEQIAKGLRALHRMKMLHQDLKPENVIIDRNGTVKLIDFGSTKVAGIEELAPPLGETEHLGTINYSAPEYHRGIPVSPASDIFSMALISYELLTGKLPFERKINARKINKLNYISAKQRRLNLPY